MTDSPLFGRYLELYVSRSTDQEIWEAGQTGGTCTQLAASALKAGIVRSCWLVDKNSKRKACTTRPEVIACAGSKYGTISPSGSTPLDPLLVTLLPCETMTDCLNIGLFCGYRITDEGIQEILRREKLTTKPLSPRQFQKLKAKYWWLYTYHTPRPCRTCTLFSAELADVSIGDIHIPGGGTARANLLIVRTSKGRDLVKTARKHLSLQKITESQAVDKCGTMIHYKKQKNRLALQLHTLACRLPHTLIQHTPTTLLVFYARIIRKLYAQGKQS